VFCFAGICGTPSATRDGGKIQQFLDFVAGRSEVVDKGDVWWVTFDNTLPALVGSVRPRSIAVEIRKTNGEIVALPASPSKIDKQHGK
jgi:hypothetical protein